MYQEIRIDSMDGVFELLKEIPFDVSSGRYRHSFLYRGLSNSDYKLTTTLLRNCGNLQRNLEEPILRNFTKYAMTDDPSVGESLWRAMLIGQHHGLPTRLLDWTFSPLIGLHFAVSERDMDRMSEHDCALWKIDARENNDNLPKDWRDKLTEHNAFYFTMKMLEELHIAELGAYDRMAYNPHKGIQGMMIVEPPSIDMRIVNQYSFFSIIPSDIEVLDNYLHFNTNRSVKYLIDRKLRWQIRDMLDSLNITERMVFPGLDGLCTWLARHYYVVR